jgi:tRNA G18 (ribose-2'-O)-methylase SpoU
MAKAKNTKKQRDTRIFLDNIRSTHNVGSIFRTAETIGISRVYCVGTTPTPIDRFGRKRADIAKVSLGGEDSVPWEYIPQAKSILRLKELKKEGFQIISVEQDDRSVDYKKVKVKNKAVIIFGNEVGGVSKEILKLSHVVAEIPLRGKKESLNVSVSAGVALFRLLDK